MITRLTSLVFLAALCLAFIAPGAVCAEEPTVDEVLQKMNDKA